MTAVAEAEETTTDEGKAKEAKTWKPNPGSIHRSLANYINEHTDGTVDEVTPEQAEALLKLHKHWQGSPERKAEREQEQREAAEEAEKKKLEREAAKAKKKAEDEAKKKAKEAAADGSDSDLDALDELDDEPAEAAPKPAKRTRRPRGGQAAEPAADDDL